jgi:cation-transporting ATPase E
MTGLSQQQVAERIRQGLTNQSYTKSSKTIGEIFIENLFSVFNIIIFSIIIFLLIFYTRLNDERLLLDSLGVFTIAFINTFIAIYQEIKAKRALDKVSLLLKKESIVIREGTEKAIDQADIVLNDVIKIERGDQIVVDGRVLKSNHLEIDESLLTGESEPAEKKEDDTLLSGSFCVSGSGYYEALKIGDQCYASGVTRLAKKYQMKISPLLKRLNLIVKALFISAVILIILQLIIRGGSFESADFIRKISTILISLVPQGLVLMASVTFALGVYRISKTGAIVQKLNAIESFSNVQVVCTDKTGTLTQNKLSVNQVNIVNLSYTHEQVEKLLGTYAIFSTDKNATLRTLEKYGGDPSAKVNDEMPFSSEKKMSLLQLEFNNENMKMVMGGYDILVDKCKNRDKLTALFNERILKVYRNLLFGKEVSGKSISEIKENPENVIIEPICIISITDEVRHDIMDAINLFNKNNVEIKILSGDSAASVQAVAKEIGWNIKDDELISGDEIDNIGDKDFPETVKKKKIFARLIPEHKLRIIKTFKKEKIYTAMIGDGVNDLPAIKESNMGIAMEEGSKITKEVADIVLLKNKFSLLPHIFDEGNKIVNTVASVAKLFLTKNFMVIYLTLSSIILLLDFPLTPRRVSLINIFAIGLPSFIIALKNSNTSKHKYFMKDLFSFVTISGFVIVTAGYTGLHYASAFPDVTHEDLQMVMMSIMIVTTTANFLCVALHKGERQVKLYSIYALCLVGLFIFLTAVNIDFIPLNLIKTFYEISYLGKQYWGLIGMISFLSSGVLFVLQYIRGKVTSA